MVIEQEEVAVVVVIVECAEKGGEEDPHDLAQMHLSISPQQLRQHSVGQHVHMSISILQKDHLHHTTKRDTSMRWSGSRMTCACWTFTGPHLGEFITLGT